MSRLRKPPLSPQHLARLRWLAPLAILILVALFQSSLQFLMPAIPASLQPWLMVTLYGGAGGLLAWFTLDGLARQLARQEQTETELRAAYESLAKTHRHLLAVHDIGCEIASASDMQQVLELAARAPTHLAGAKGSTIVTFDDEGQRLKLDMAWGLSDTYLQGLRQRMEAGISLARCQQCDPLTARLDTGCALFEGLEELARRDGIQSLICLPITRNQKREGVINAYFPSPDGPPEEQIQLLNIVATEIVSALDSARLRASQMATLYAMENLGQAEQSLDDLLAQVLDTTLAGWGVGRGAILLFDEAKAAWHHWTQRGLGDDSPTGPRFELALQLAEAIRHKREAVIVADLAHDPVWKTASDPRAGSAAVAPLSVGSELLGALVLLADRPNFFKPGQTSFFSALAHQATLAINNAQLHTQVQQLAILEERYRLSREIHDGLAQTLGSLGWHLDHLSSLLSKKELDRLETELAAGRRMVREAYMEVREAIDGLRLQGESSSDLAATLQEYLIEFEQRTGLTAALEMSAEPVALSAETELQLLRIVQEALINVRKHAQASQVWVRLQRQNEQWVLTIADDGRGFDPALPRGRGHLGMATMRERAESQQGTFTVVTGPNQGTRLTITFPAGEKARQNMGLKRELRPL